MSAVIGGLGSDGALMVIGAGGNVQANPGMLISGRRTLKGWYSGTGIDSEDTMAFSVRHGVRSMNEVFPMARIAEAYERMLSGKARFRVVVEVAAPA